MEKAAPSNHRPATGSRLFLFKWAASQEQAPRDRTRDVFTVRLPQRQPRSLWAKQLHRLLRAVHSGGSRRAVAIIELLAGTGLRVGELLQLQVGDLVLRKRSGGVKVREGKHGGYHEVPLTKEVRRALVGYLKTHPYNKEEHDQYQDARAPL